VEKLQYGRTGSTMHYYPAYQPRFATARLNTILSQSYVLYWQYEKDLDDLGRIKAMPDYWDYMQRMMPVGISRTDANGYLQELSYKENADIMSMLFIERQVKGGKACYRLTINAANRIKNRAQYARKLNYKSMCAFTPNKPVGFMILPLDMDDAFSVDILDLLDFGKRFCGDLLWFGYVQREHQLIHLPLHSLAWAKYIGDANDMVEVAMQVYQTHFTELTEKLQRFSQLQNFLDIYRRYPRLNDPWVRSQVGEMLSLLGECQSYLYDEYVAKLRGLDKDAEFSVRYAADYLLKLLLHDDLAAKQLFERAYRVECIDNNIDALFVWDDECLAKVLMRAFQLMAQVPNSSGENEYSGLIYERYIAPLMALAGADETAKYIKGSGSVEKLLSYSSQLAPPLAANFPGPPSLVVALINSVGQYYSRKNFNSKISKQQVKSLLKTIKLSMRLLNGNQALKHGAWENIEADMYAGRLSLDKNSLADMLGNTLNLGLSSSLLTVYHGVMRSLLICALSIRVKEDSDNPLKWSTGVLASSSALALSVDGLIAQLFSLSRGKLQLSLGVVGFFAESAYALFEAIESSDRDDSLAAIKFCESFLQATSAVLFLMAGVTPVFVVVLLLSVIAQIGEDIYLIERPKAKTLVDDLLDKLTKIYQHDAFINRRLSSMYHISGRLNWQRLSWRALVPLYESGFRVDGKRSPMMLYDGSLDLLAAYVDLTFLPEKFRIRDADVGWKSWHANFDEGEADTKFVLPALRAFFSEYFSLIAMARSAHGSADIELIQWRNGTQYPRELPTAVL